MCGTVLLADTGSELEQATVSLSFRHIHRSHFFLCRQVTQHSWSGRLMANMLPRQLRHHGYGREMGA